jgi:hypothetical protein
MKKRNGKLVLYHYALCRGGVIVAHGVHDF